MGGSKLATCGIRTARDGLSPRTISAQRCPRCLETGEQTGSCQERFWLDICRRMTRLTGSEPWFSKGAVKGGSWGP